MSKLSNRPSNPSLQFMSFTPKPRATKLGDSDIFEVSLRPWPAVAQALTVPLRKRFKDEKEADTYCAALVAALQDYRQGRRVYRGPRDLETLQALYLRALRANGRAPRTIQATEHRLSVFSTVLNAVGEGVGEDVTGLLPWHLQAIKTALSESPYEYGTNHLHNVMASTHGFLGWCVHPQGAIEENPAKGLVPPRGAPKRLSLSPTHRAQLREVADPKRWRIYALVMLTGLRRGELRQRLVGGEVLSGSNLTVQSVERGLRGWFLRVTNKGKTREVPLEGRALEIVSDLIAEATAAGRDELIPVTYNTLADWWKWDRGRARRALSEAGKNAEADAWANLTFHSLRGTAITVMVNDLRLPLGDVAAIVGHEDIRTTENYRQPDEAMVRRSLSALSESMFPQSSGTVAVHANQHRA